MSNGGGGDEPNRDPTAAGATVGNEAKSAPTPPQPVAGPAAEVAVNGSVSRWRKVGQFAKDFDGVLLLVGLLATINVSFVVDRGNRIEDDVAATHAVLDSALDTAMAHQVTEPRASDDDGYQKQMSLLRYRAASGQYRVAPAQDCINTIIKQIDDYGHDKSRVSFLENGDPVETGERIMQRLVNLRKKVDIWKFETQWFIFLFRSGDHYFGKCFE